MDDVIIDDRRQISAKDKKNQREASKGRRVKRSFRRYLVDLVIKSLIATAFIAIDFTLFAEAGSYSLFTQFQHLTPEALTIYGGIAAVCFGLMFLFSFSVFFQNLLVSGAFAFLVWSFISQFALFDKASFLAGYLGKYAASSQSFSLLLNSHSQLLLTVFGSLIFLISIMRSRRSTQFYFLGILIFICGGLLSEAYFNPVIPSFRTVHDETPEVQTQTDGKNFVFIGLPALTSYHNLDALKTQAEGKPQNTAYNGVIQRAMDNMLGFYTHNNFTFYTQAYVSRDNPFANLIELYNPQQPETDPLEYTLDNVLLSGYWDFGQISSQPLYLKENKVFDSFRKGKYRLNVYQSRGLQSCYLNNRLTVQKCLSKENLPINLADSGYSTMNKTLLLLHQWLESADIIQNFNLIYEIVRFVNPGGLGGVSFSTKELYVLNSPKTFDILAHDIASGKGNNAYFAVIDLPSDLYAYDEMCNLKEPGQWLSAASNPDFRNNNRQNKKEAYAEQISCLYGQLENFMQKLSADAALSRTVVVIAGLNNPDFIVKEAKPDDFYAKFRTSRQVNLAIYDPLQKVAKTEDSLCSSSSILKSYLYKNYPCQRYDNLGYADKLIKDLEKIASDSRPTDETKEQAVKKFKDWYATWASYNQVENFLAAPQSKKQTTSDKPVEEIKKAPEPTALQEEQKEAAVEPLPAEPVEKTDAVLPEIPLEAAPKVNIKTKVIDKEQGHDVIPPFLEDEPEPQKAKPQPQPSAAQAEIDPNDIPAQKKAALRAKLAKSGVK